eukprot:202589-Rhodomonas_salina.2
MEARGMRWRRSLGPCACSALSRTDIAIKPFNLSTHISLARKRPRPRSPTCARLFNTHNAPPEWQRALQHSRKVAAQQHGECRLFIDCTAEAVGSRSQQGEREWGRVQPRR